MSDKIEVGSIWGIHDKYRSADHSYHDKVIVKEIVNGLSSYRYITYVDMRGRCAVAEIVYFKTLYYPLGMSDML